MRTQVQFKCSIITDKCINGESIDGEEPRSVKIDESFLTTNKDGKRCLILAVVTGDIDCKYWMSDGLGADVAAVRPLTNKALRSAVRDKPAEWTIENDLLPDDTQPYSYDFAEVMIHAVYLSLSLSFIVQSTLLVLLRWPTRFGCASCRS